MMNIYTKKGSKIRYTGKNGTNWDKTHANMYLKIGEIYTVEHIEIGGYLDEYKDILKLINNM